MKFKKALAAALAGTMVLGGASTVFAEEWEYKEAELSIMLANDISTEGFDAVCALAEEKLGIHVEVEIVNAQEVLSLVKTRLAAGDMSDIIYVNSGSLLATLAPAEYMLDISEEEWASRLDDAFVQAASVDGKLYGIPFSSSFATSVLYNTDIYEEYGLEIPTTWDEFLANCATLKEAGETALIGSFADAWSTQLPFLGDHANLVASEPDFTEKFDAGEAKYAESEAGLESWQKLADLTEYYNEDYLATTYNDALDKLVNGEGAHYIMFSNALSSIYSAYGDEVNNIRLFPVLGDDPEAAALTVWAPNALYGNKNSEKTEDILRFMEFYISDEALDAYTSVVPADGPFMVKGYELSGDGYDAVKLDMQPYFDAGKTTLALEFVTQIKGANCPAICQEVGSGQITAAEGAAEYDADCVKQAIQLGYDWE